MELALGTAQFGMNYGIAGRRKSIPPAEIRHIMAKSWEAGIRVVDIAPAYGNIEQEFVAYAEGSPFSIISKISTIPSTIDKNDVIKFVNESVRCSQRRLGDGLKTLLFHNCGNLLGNNAVIKMHKKFMFQEEGFRRSHILKDGERLGVNEQGLARSKGGCF